MPLIRPRQRCGEPKLVFDSECRRIYDAESPGLRDKMSLEKYIAAVVIPDVLRQIQSSPPPPSI
jgi:hypothetical protein